MTYKKAIKTNINIRIDKGVKDHLQIVLASHGLSISEAIRLYLWQIVTQGGVPFKGFVSTKLPTKEKEPSEMDREFTKLYAALRISLVQNNLRKLAEKHVEPKMPTPEEDWAIINAFIAKTMEERNKTSDETLPAT